MSDGCGDRAYKEEWQDVNQKLSAFQHSLWLGPTCWLEPGKQTLAHKLWESEASAAGSGKGLEWPGYTYVLPFSEVLLSPDAIRGRAGVGGGGQPPFWQRLFSGERLVCIQKRRGSLSSSLLLLVNLFPGIRHHF